MKLSLAVALVTLLVAAGTLMICLSGAVTERTMEYGSANAAVHEWITPYLKFSR